MGTHNGHVSFFRFVRFFLFFLSTSTFGQTNDSSPALYLQNYDRTVYFVGDFDSTYVTFSEGQTLVSSGTVDLGNPGSQSIRAQLPDGTFTTLASSNGVIRQMCSLSGGSQNISAAVVVAGNFTTLAGVDTSSTAVLDYTTGQVLTSFDLDHDPAALLCDTENVSIYVATPVAKASQAISKARVASTHSSTLPLGIINGPINTMEKSPTGSILFGGSFDAFQTANSSVPIGRTLNGILEWSASQESPQLDTPLVNFASTLITGAMINKLIVVNESIYVFGNFSASGLDNVFVFEEGRGTALPGGGLNGPVMAAVHLPGLDMLIMAGDFNDFSSASVTGLNNIAAYSIADKRWQTLGTGVSGPVHALSLLSVSLSSTGPESVVVVNGPFDQILPSSYSDLVAADGIGAWVPSREDWLHNLDVINETVFEGEITAYAHTPTDVTLFAGTFSSWASKTSGIIGVSAQNIDDLGLQFEASPSSHGSGILAGSPFSLGQMTGVIVGGSFTARDTNTNETIYNVAILHDSDEHNVTGFPNFPPNATVQCFVQSGNYSQILFIGGVFEQAVRGQIVNGLLTYDLWARDYTEVQPPTLGGTAVQVEAMALAPTGLSVYVGGTFDTAGGDDCSTVCAYDLSSSTWMRCGSNLNGTVRFMSWLNDDNLLVGGDITVDGMPVTLATYFVSKKEWAPFNVLQPLTGVVTAMSRFDTYISQDSSDDAEIWVAGRTPDDDPFLVKWRNGHWSEVTDGFESTTSFTSLQVFSYSNTHEDSEYVDDNGILLVTGNIVLPNVGLVSAALYDGASFYPYIISRTANKTHGSITSVPILPGVGIVEFDHEGLAVPIAASFIAFLVFVTIVGEVENVWHRRRAASRTTSKH